MTLYASGNSLRVYFDPDEIGGDGYPLRWHLPVRDRDTNEVVEEAIKHLIRQRDGGRCLRCRHPYVRGDGEWSRCDDRCLHGGPVSMQDAGEEGPWVFYETIPTTAAIAREDEGPHGLTIRFNVRAQWRILTVHHLNGVKYDCRWWNLVSLCQRCHLTIQSKVVMERPWHGEHAEWFKPFAAAWYAFRYEGVELSREEVDSRLDDLLAYERNVSTLEGFPDVERRY